MTVQSTLDLGLITVHCFACPHVEVGVSPDDAHDCMERHYVAAHAALIGRLVAS
jgi:hypothetical protein